MDKPTGRRHIRCMSAPVDMVFEEAKKLGSDEIEELMGRLAALNSDTGKLPEHAQIVEELRQRVDGPFESLDTDEERRAMKERVIAKGEKIMRERYGETQ